MNYFSEVNSVSGGVLATCNCRMATLGKYRPESHGKTLPERHRLLNLLCISEINFMSNAYEKEITRNLGNNRNLILLGCRADADIDNLTAQVAELKRAKTHGAGTETQKSISQWATETFGEAGSNMRVATRTNEEMAELLSALSVDQNHEKAAEECADIVIILYRLCERLGKDLNHEVDKKMTKNRKREWERDGSCHGYHRKHVS